MVRQADAGTDRVSALFALNGNDRGEGVDETDLCDTVGGCDSRRVVADVLPRRAASGHAVTGLRRGCKSSGGQHRRQRSMNRLRRQPGRSRGTASGPMRTDNC